MNPLYYSGICNIQTYDETGTITYRTVDEQRPAILTQENDGSYTLRFTVGNSFTGVVTPFPNIHSERDENDRLFFSGVKQYYQDEISVTLTLIEKSYIKNDSLYITMFMNIDGYHYGDYLFRGKLIEQAPTPLITWERQETATGYTIDIYDATGELVVTLEFDADGNYIGIVQRSGSLKTTEEFSFDASILDLEKNATYYYTISALNGEETVQIKEGVFTMSDETGTAVLAAESSAFSVSPNPATSVVNISFSDTGNADIIIRDMQGRSVKTIQSTTQQVSIDISNLAQGVYVVYASQNGVNFREQLIVQ